MPVTLLLPDLITFGFKSPWMLRMIIRMIVRSAYDRVGSYATVWSYEISIINQTAVIAQLAELWPQHRWIVSSSPAERHPATELFLNSIILMIIRMIIHHTSDWEWQMIIHHTQQLCKSFPCKKLVCRVGRRNTHIGMAGHNGASLPPLSRQDASPARYEWDRLISCQFPARTVHQPPFPRAGQTLTGCCWARGPEGRAGESKPARASRIYERTLWWRETHCSGCPLRGTDQWYGGDWMWICDSTVARNFGSDCVHAGVRDEWQHHDNDDTCIKGNRSRW